MFSVHLSRNHYFCLLSLEFREQKTKKVSQDSHSQYALRLSASSQDQVVADGRRHRSNIHLLLGSVSPSGARLLVRVT